MTSSKIGMILGLAALSFSISSVDQGQTLAQSELSPAPDAANKAAAESLGTFKELISPENAKTYGFDAPGAVASAKVGSPVHEAIIGLDSLKNWNGQNPEGLIKPTGRLIYPIVSKDGSTRSSVTLGQKDGGWIPVSFGDTRNSQIRSDIRNHIDASVPPGAAKPELFEVRIPALNLNFLAQLNDSNMLFTSMQTIPSIDIKAGATEPAKDILPRVQRLAVKVSSDVPN